MHTQTHTHTRAFELQLKNEGLMLNAKDQHINVRNATYSQWIINIGAVSNAFVPV